MKGENSYSGESVLRIAFLGRTRKTPKKLTDICEQLEARPKEMDEMLLKNYTD